MEVSIQTELTHQANLGTIPEVLERLVTVDRSTVLINQTEVVLDLTIGLLCLIVVPSDVQTDTSKSGEVEHTVGVETGNEVREVQCSIECRSDVVVLPTILLISKLILATTLALPSVYSEASTPQLRELAANSSLNIV